MSVCSHLDQIRVTALPVSNEVAFVVEHVSAAAEAYAGEAAP
jgi:hypothetical protein